MKAIKLSEKMLIRENKRSVDRTNDILLIELSIEPIFGSVVNANTQKTQKNLPVQISKSRASVLWNKLKDSSNDTVMEELCLVINHILDLKNKLINAEKAPTYKEAIQETVNGELIYWYKKDSLSDFNAAAKRTSVSSIMIKQPNPYEKSLDELNNKYPLDEFSILIDYLMEVDFDIPFVTVEI